MKETPPSASLTLEALSEEIVSTAISTVVQNTLTAMLRSSEAREDPSIDEFLPAETAALQSTLFSETELNDGSTATATTDTAESPIEPHTLTEEEDFELLDQSELEQMDEELGLISENQGSAMAGSTAPDPSRHTQQS